MQRKIMLLAAMAMMAVSAVGVEGLAVDSVKGHYPWDGKVDCVTTLSGIEKGFVYDGEFTISVQQGGKTVRRVVSKRYAAGNGTYTNTFDCAELFGSGVYPDGGISIKLVKSDDRTGTPIGIFGDVLVIDVSGGDSATSYPTAELVNVDMGTFNCDVYKTDKIVLRKIPAGSYYCQPREENYEEDATQKLTTKGFYIGVFPVTQRQYELVMGTNPSWYKTNETDNVAAHRPVDRAFWNVIRGGVEAQDEITASSGDSFLQRLVAKTGLSGFDLPTEAQWEIAARANSATEYGAYWNGTSAVTITPSNYGDVAWYGSSSSATTHAVGGKKPNLWGLYDTHGNILEWCRDIYDSDFYPECVDEPYYDILYYDGTFRVGRGGCMRTLVGCGLSVRVPVSLGNDINFFSHEEGFRLKKTCP